MIRRAFTLVEMLVAMVLLTLLIGVAVFSFRMQLMAIYKVKTSSLKKVLLYTQIKSSLESTKFYVIQQYDRFGNSMNKFSYFFKGNKKSITFITTSPLHYKVDCVAKYICNERNLEYKEEPLFKNIDFSNPIIPNNAWKKILLKGVEECTFKYKVNNNFLDNINSEIPQAVWLSIESKKGNFNIFTNIKSDNNLTKARIISVVNEE